QRKRLPHQHLGPDHRHLRLGRQPLLSNRLCRKQCPLHSHYHHQLRLQRLCLLWPERPARQFQRHFQPHISQRTRQLHPHRHHHRPTPPRRHLPSPHPHTERRRRPHTPRLSCHRRFNPGGDGGQSHQQHRHRHPQGGRHPPAPRHPPRLQGPPPPLQHQRHYR